MTLRSSDLQSVSDLDSIRNSCDVFISQELLGCAHNPMFQPLPICQEEISHYLSLGLMILWPVYDLLRRWKLDHRNRNVYSGWHHQIKAKKISIQVGELIELKTVQKLQRITFVKSLQYFRKVYAIHWKLCQKLRKVEAANKLDSEPSLLPNPSHNNFYI